MCVCVYIRIHTYTHVQINVKVTTIKVRRRNLKVNHSKTKVNFVKNNKENYFKKNTVSGQLKTHGGNKTSLQKGFICSESRVTSKYKIKESMFQIYKEETSISCEKGKESTRCLKITTQKRTSKKNKQRNSQKTKQTKIKTN